MNHLGDITKIKGSEVALVNVIIGGSPCQGLSIAGKCLGLNDERSGLFMEQIRLIKEMREEDAKRGRTGKEIRPRFMVWENVPGAFSSNKGADFGAVLQETIKVVCEEAPAVPMPKNGWPTSGCLTDVAGKWSVAWRVLDAQFFGVPQRRRRITLIADFGGLSAPEILFERESVSGNSSQSRTPWEILTRNAESCIGATGCEINESFCIQGNCIDRADTAGCNGKGWTEDKSYTLNTMDRHAVALSNVASKLRVGAGAPKHKSDILGRSCLSPTNNTAVAIENHPNDSRVKISEDNVVQTLSSRMGTGGAMFHSCYDVQETVYTATCGSFMQIDKNKSSTLLARDYKQPQILCTKKNKSYLMRMRSGCDGGGKGPLIQEEKSGTLATGNDQTLFASTARSGQQINAVDCRNATEDDIPGALQSAAGHSLNCNNTIRQDFTVRRLTPLECERLQGFPDGWTQIGEVVDYKRHQEFDSNGTLVNEWVEAIYEYIDCNGKKRKSTDSARYKALGNSIALPPWFWVLERLSLVCGTDVTMASLFDGIGGFPLIWQTLNGEGTCLWASEIEGFPIAVTQQRINGSK